MEKSFFKRRKILKQTNSLDLHPIRLMESEKRDTDNLNILLPRFKNKLAFKLLQPSWKGEFIRIKLDNFGSAVWELIDGHLTTADICDMLKERFPEKQGLLEETEERVSKFLSLLYQQRFISFTELQNNHATYEK
ncbi:MAG: PqqD family peptide modification chaperone [Bacteroidetes bacterium]|nr:PqqD family peptide modification chaperone [Bacteroidota bacterium]